MAANSSRRMPVAVVALASWLTPGLGYWLIGQRGRALASGITIVVLFVVGLLIGGVRLVEVPGWGDHGQKLVLRSGGRVAEQDPPAEGGAAAGEENWVLTSDPMYEIRNKPWFVAQVLAGPIDLAAAWGSIRASRPGPDGSPIGARSHSRTNELGVLYTAVAGMLNLLVIIDAAHRANRANVEAA